MKHYLFEDLETGEEFIVGADTMDEAKDIAFDNFGATKYLCRLSEAEAEASGLDEY